MKTFVSKEFLAQEKQLGQTMPKSKKKMGGPYPAQIKKTRRDEVFRLHFDYGYSARKIANMMNVNRNTINSDITFWYSQIQKDDSKALAEDLINKTLYRLETKRVRLMEKLDKTTVLGEFLILEKMLYEIDNKIMQIALKIQNSNQSVYDKTMNMFNDWLEENGYKERYVLWGQTLRVTPDTLNKVKQVIRSDKHQKPTKPKPRDFDSENSDAISQCKF